MEGKTTTIKMEMPSSDTQAGYHRGMTCLGPSGSATGFQFQKPRNSNLSVMGNETMLVIFKRDRLHRNTNANLLIYVQHNYC